MAVIKVNAWENIACLDLYHSNNASDFDCTLAMLFFEYDSRTKRMKVKPPHFVHPSFEQYKPQCRDVLKKWLVGFATKYYQLSPEVIEIKTFPENLLSMELYITNNNQRYFSCTLITFQYDFISFEGFTFYSPTNIHYLLEGKIEKCNALLFEWAEKYLCRHHPNERLGNISQQKDFRIPLIKGLPSQLSLVIPQLISATNTNENSISKPTSTKKRTCSQCGKQFDCHDAFDKFSIGCEEFRPEGKIF